MNISSALRSTFSFFSSCTTRSDRTHSTSSSSRGGWWKSGCVSSFLSRIGITKLYNWALTKYRARYGNTEAHIQAQQISAFNGHVLESDLDPSKQSVFPGVAQKTLDKVMLELTEADVKIEESTSALLETALVRLKKKVTKEKEKLTAEHYCSLLYDALKLSAIESAVQANLKAKSAEKNVQLDTALFERAIKRRKIQLEALLTQNGPALKNGILGATDFVQTTMENIETEQTVIQTCLALGIKALKWGWGKLAPKLPTEVQEAVKTVKGMLHDDAKDVENKKQADNGGKPTPVPKEEYEEKLSSNSTSYFQSLIDMTKIAANLLENPEQAFNFATKAMAVVKEIKHSDILKPLTDKNATEDQRSESFINLYNQIVVTLQTEDVFGKEWSKLPLKTQELILRMIYLLMSRQCKELTSEFSSTEMLQKIHAKLDTMGLNVTKLFAEAPTGSKEAQRLFEKSKGINGAMKMLDRFTKGEYTLQ